MPSDLARAHAARLHRHDLVIESGEAVLLFGDKPQIQARLTVARYVDRQLTGPRERP